MDFKTPEEIYSEMSDEDIILIAYQPEGLELEHIPIIQKELIKRRKQDEALMLSEYLIAANQKVNISQLSNEELKQYINQRLEQGEPLEAIRLDLKENDINIFDIISAENQQRDDAFDYITELKQKGYEEYEIDGKIREKYDLKQNDIEDLRLERNRSGKLNLIFGILIVIVAVILIPYAAEQGGRRYIGAVGILVLGVWQIYTGYQKMK